jgi:hypothetical protein
LDELSLHLSLSHLTGEDHKVREKSDQIFALIEKCYFDNFINHNLVLFLPHLRITADQWKILFKKIKQSSVEPLVSVLEILFLQALPHDDLFDDLRCFLEDYSCSELLAIFDAVQSNDAQKSISLLNTKNNTDFSLKFIQAIIKKEIAIPVANAIRVGGEQERDLLFIRLGMLRYWQKHEDALSIISGLDTKDIAPSGLDIVARITYENERWDLFIRAALELLKREIDIAFKAQIHGWLATAYFHLNDDTNTIYHAEEALKYPDIFGETNSQMLLSGLGQSLAIKGQYDAACEKFSTFKHVKRSFPLFLQEAELYSKSSRNNKYEIALSLILKAYEQADAYNDELYLAAYMLLVELGNSGVVPLQNEPVIEEGLFVKLDGLTEGWFYIGDSEKSLGAIPLGLGDSRYAALIHKPISEEIEWPADKYSRRGNRKILHIATAAAFLSVRANEAIQSAAAQGRKGIFFVEAFKEDGSVDFEMFKQAFSDQESGANEFFQKYITSHIPFAFLCKKMGGVGNAVAKISQEEQGFIRCNNGTEADLSAQRARAIEVLDGKLCFIEGLSALILAEAGLLSAVIDKVPSLGVSSSVIRLIRKVAARFESVSGDGGRASFSKDRFQLSQKNSEQESLTREKLLHAADLLDNLSNKVLDRTRSTEAVNMQSVVPDYFSTAFYHAQEKKTHILTDDAILIEAYRVTEPKGSYIPQHFSSISLVKAMAERGIISWRDYLQYFALLSGYRYHLLHLTVDDLWRTVFGSTTGGLVNLQTKGSSAFQFKLHSIRGNWSNSKQRYERTFRFFYASNYG